MTSCFLLYFCRYFLYKYHGYVAVGVILVASDTERYTMVTYVVCFNSQTKEFVVICFNSQTKEFVVTQRLLEPY